MEPVENNPAYLAGHLTEALATDERTHLLDLKVRVAGDRVILIGNVSSDERRVAAEQVVRERMPSHMLIVNSLCVESYREPTDVEPLG